MHNRLRAIAGRISHVCAVIAGICLMAIVVLTTLNIVFRQTPFIPPITGAQEGTAFLGALLIALAMPMTQLQKSNISVEMIHSVLSTRAATTLARMNAVISAAVCLLIAWQCAAYAIDFWESGEVSMTLAVPFYPLILIVSASFAMLALIFITDCIAPAEQVSK
jgi:TRAP-type C4-dicarboxylate transport system permease small subunit